MTEHHVVMKTTRENMISMLKCDFKKKYLNSLTDEELFNLGIKNGFWSKG